MISISIGLLVLGMAGIAFRCAIKGNSKKMPQKGEG